jgi:hypothetical protein
MADVIAPPSIPEVPRAELLITEPFLPNSFGVDSSKFEKCPYHDDFVMYPKGTILIGTDKATGGECWHHVRIGKAKPANKACWDACGMTKDQVLKQFRFYSKLNRAQVTGDPKFDAPDPA